MLVCERNGCSDRDQRAAHACPTASCAVADRKNSTSVVDMVDIVDSSQVVSVVVVVVLLSSFLRVFGCLFFFGSWTFLRFLLCLIFSFWTRLWQSLCLFGGFFSLPRCRRGGHCVCLCPSHRLVSVSAYLDRFPSGLLIGICVLLGFPWLVKAK